jgi:lysophospholipase L1-like esterase
MKTTLYTLLLFTFLSFTATHPKVFVVGDSISIQYGPYLEKYLSGKADYDRKNDTPGQKAEANLDYPTGANGGDSRMVLAYLKTKVAEPGFRPDVLLLNCGLHDIKLNPKTQTHQVDSASYSQNLHAIYSLLKKQKIPLVWVRSTAVVDSIHNSRSTAFHRHARDLDAYNRIADEVWKEHRVPVIDLYSFTQNLPGNNYIDHVHYNENTRALQAAYIAGYLTQYLQK